MTAIPGYLCFRDDRNDRIGGGVAIWSSSHLRPQKVNVTGKPVDIETVAIRVIPNMLIVGCYVPPHAVAHNHVEISAFLINFLDDFSTRHPNSHIILCGDFNRLDMRNICQNCSLVNLYQQATYGNAELDYVLISESAASMYCVSAAAPIDKSSTPHLSLLCSPISYSQRPLESGMEGCRVVYDLRESNVAKFLVTLNDIDWSFLEENHIDLNQKCELFHKYINDAFHVAIPTKLVTYTSKTKPWITPLVKSLINDRWNAYRMRNFTIYNHLKEKLKIEMEKAKLMWVKKMKNQNVWRMMNTVNSRKGRHALASLYPSCTSLESMAHMINDRLASVFAQKVPVVCPEIRTKTIAVSEYDVQRWISRIPNHKASPDIPVKLYKAASYVLAYPMTLLFRESLKLTEVPTKWKTAAVVPIPKPGERGEIRPISLLTIPSKTLEYVILQFAKPYFLRAYGSEQFGFRPASSTTCALIALHDYMTKTLEFTNVSAMQMITYDFEKAFDRLRHDVIIKRLIQCDMPSELIGWISDYLNGRRQYVRIGDTNSSSVAVTSGVPQGSILGPFLFAVVIGSLTLQSRDCCVIKYADDVTICTPIYKNNANSHVSEIHNEIVSWSSRNMLTLNFRKCKTLVVGRTSISEDTAVNLPNVINVDTLTILGVVFNKRGNWKDHTKNTVVKASRRLFPLRIIKPLVTQSALKTLYNGLMRSVMEYAAPLLVGLSKNDSRRLEALQNRFHRLMCGKGCTKGCLQALTERRKMLATRLYLSAGKGDLIHKQTVCDISRSGRYVLPHIRTTQRLNAFPIKVAMILNHEK